MIDDIAIFNKLRPFFIFKIFRMVLEQAGDGQFKRGQGVQELS